jgi:hypothetical protein
VSDADEIGTVVQVLPPNRRVILFRLTLAMIVLGSYFYWLSRRGRPYPTVIVVMGAVIVLYIFWPMLRLLLGGDAILITDRGLVNYTSGVVFVAWREIRAARLRSILWSKLVELDLPDPEPVLLRMSPVRRMLLRRFMRAHGGKAMLAAMFVQGGPKALLEIIRARIPPIHEPGR